MLSSTILPIASAQSEKGRLAQISNIDPIKSLSGDVIGPFYPQVASSGKNVYVAFQSTLVSHNEIYLVTSSDSGTTFGNPINISESNGGATLPLIAASGNHVYVVWTQVDDSFNSQIYFRASDDAGCSFSPKIMLSASDGDAHRPQIAAHGKDVYVVWEQAPTSRINYDVYFTKSENFGSSFNEAINLSHNSDDSISAHIAISGQHMVYVAWSDYSTASGHADVYFVRSGDKGDSFGPIQNLSNNSAPSIEPIVAAAGKSVYVLWNDGNDNSNLLLAKSGDTGKTFDPNLADITSDGLASSFKATTVKDISVNAKDLYIVWEAFTPGGGGFHVILAVSNDKGSSFNKYHDMDPGSSFAILPDIDSHGKKVTVAWSGPFGTIQTRESSDRGATLQDPTLIAASGAESEAKISMSGKNTYIVWTGLGDAGFQILFTRTSG